MTQHGRGFPLREVIVARARGVQPAGTRLFTLGPDRGKEASRGLQRDLSPQPARRAGDSITTAIPVMHGPYTSGVFYPRPPPWGNPECRIRTITRSGRDRRLPSWSGARPA